MRSLPTFEAAKRPRGRPRKTPQARNEGNRRQDVVKAAAKLFRRYGFNGTSTRDIACAVGMHSGSLFCHFKSKDALLHEVIQEGMRSAMARQMIVLLAEHDAVTTLRQLIRSHFETILGPNSDFMHVVLYESRYLNAMQHKVIAKLQGEYEATWTSVLQELSLTGCLQVEVPVARHLLFGVLNGSAQWFKSEMGISIDDLTDAVVALCKMTKTVTPGMTEGEIRKIDKEKVKITIKHGEIKHMNMPPMAMVFNVKDKAMLDKVQPGE